MEGEDVFRIHQSSQSVEVFAIDGVLPPGTYTLNVRMQSAVIFGDAEAETSFTFTVPEPAFPQFMLAVVGILLSRWQR